MAKIIFIDHDGTRHSVDVPNGSTVMRAALDNGIPGIDADCGGGCACATCHVFVDDTWLSQLPERGDDETELVESTEHFNGNNSRLSCQIPFSDNLDGLKVTVAPEE